MKIYWSIELWDLDDNTVKVTVPVIAEDVPEVCGIAEFYCDNTNWNDQPQTATKITSSEWLKVCGDLVESNPIDL